jgi:hypothetical protein
VRAARARRRRAVSARVADRRGPAARRAAPRAHGLAVGHGVAPVNGVSALHSNCACRRIFADFARCGPERFHNVTNGVTPRRWLQQANPALSALLDAHIGTGWRRDLMELQASWPSSGQEDAAARRSARPSAANKERLAALVRTRSASGARPRQPVRRAGQAHPRVQAPVAEPAARGGALAGHRRQSGAGPRRPAAGCRAR